MPSKQKLDKVAWEWAEKVEPSQLTQTHIETAYRVNSKPCKVGSCRRNCKGNPHCFSGLGERNWLHDIADEEWHEIDDPNSERRDKDSFVGLKNLGATCYVNSFLQVWYHNPAFRKVIYQWKPEDDPQEIESKSSGEVNEKGTIPSFNPSSCIGHLQLIFAFLQFSVRRYIDPTPLINNLGLNTSQQQDAQEFSKLFISLLEEKLSYQSNPNVRNFVQEHYSGKYEYVTKCDQCLNESTRPSLFYELDLNIKGHKDIYSCLEEFLKEEKLEGSNQYYCSFCQCKQNATRAIRLLRLPSHLNFQLLRFVFDRQSGRKKKLNSFISFCEVLDLSKYLHKEENSILYDLYAVLIHRGPSAYSGHYVAHIQDRISGCWFKFNDETVEKMEGKKLLKLGAEESLIDNSKSASKAPKLTKGSHTSNNAYMLVYRLRNSEHKDFPPDTSVEWDLPEHLQQVVVEDNSKFEEWVDELAVMREQTVMTGKARQNEIRSIYEILPAKEGMPFEWISTDWLAKWLTSDVGNVPPIDNSQCLCSHGKLHPDKVPNMKCVNVEAAEKLFNKYGGGPRISDSLCRNCVEARCQFLHMKARIQNETKQLATLLKQKLFGDENAYWIGKSSLRTWKGKVLNHLDTEEEKPKTECASDGDENTEKNNMEVGNSDDMYMSEADGQDDVPMAFNEDILCDHGNLSVDENCRRLIPEKAWLIFKGHFPTAPEFSRTSSPCSFCKAQKLEDEQRQIELRFTAQEQKSCLQDLYLDKSRPSFEKVTVGNMLYVVCRQFVDDWKKFVKDPIRKKPVYEISNSSLLCEHGGLLYTINEKMDPKLVLLWEHEWSVIKSKFTVDVEIAAFLVEEINGNSVISTNPELCTSCYASRLQKEQQELLEFTNAKIYVKHVSKLEEAEMNNLLLDNSCDNSHNDSVIEKHDDSEFVQNIKKMKSDEGTEIITSSQLRRSNRRRKLKGEKELIVSGNQTLRDLKIQIMKLFSVAPYDQHLTLNGMPLLNDKSTLAELYIYPESHIILKADEPNDETIVMEDYLKATVPETGFKGTELMKR